jgi:hypothetical protein
MEKPIHTHNQSYYIVLRPILWFAKGDKVTPDKLNEYFTSKAIRSLLDYDFIVIHIP